MSNMFNLAQALDRASKRVVEGYEIDVITVFEENGVSFVTFDMEEYDQPSRTFDMSQKAELVRGEADFTDVDGVKARIAFFETIPLSDNLHPA